PEIADVFDLGLQFSKSNFVFGSTIFYNQYSNVIEYSNDSDILYSLIIDNKLFNVSVDNTNWEDRVSIGKGWSYGIEFSFGFETDKLTWSNAYTLSRSQRKFTDLNDGESFPYRYDRRHNVSSQLTWSFTKNQKIMMDFAFGTGNAFTLATIEILGPDGTPRLVPISRNNGRVPDFHHLDLIYKNKKKLKSGASLEYSIGVYNIYNRLNPFYVYLFQDPVTQDFDGFRKISIYPVIPKLNVKYSW
ncbi:MAG: TonB-dependent receptor, partial [Saprospiraceae bacterium]|nr:TonB-dependent receptor [Saprospiraceae bacterium]